jgi:hypothetical protein
VRRTKKDRPPAGADENDRAKFAKLRDYLLRLDDEVVCKTCGKKYEIPSQHSLMFVDQVAGLPNDEDLEREIAQASGEPDEPPRETKPRSRPGSRANRPAGSNAGKGSCHDEPSRLSLKNGSGRRRRRASRAQLRAGEPERHDQRRHRRHQG